MSLHNSETNIYHHNQEFGLENGSSLPGLVINYTTSGELSPKKDNVVWIFHALTANADPIQWWPGLVGEGHRIDPSKYFIVCANILGSCYGSTGPRSINPKSGKPYGLDFPVITVKDMVNAHKILQKELNIDQIYLGIGGSMGGQQLLEWSIANPDLFKNISLVATNARHSPWGIAFNESQRLALKADSTFFNNEDDAGQKGMKAARAVAMLSYRNQLTYEMAQLDSNGIIDNYKASSYQEYQGEKLVKRFNAHSYYYLSKAMDSHNAGRGWDSIEIALKQIKARTSVIGIKTDLLFTPREQTFLAENIPQSKLFMIDSTYGHDGFLVETKKLSDILDIFLGDKPISSKGNPVSSRQGFPPEDRKPF